MKTVFGLLAIGLGFSSPAFADDFMCELRVQQTYRTESAMEYRGRTAIVELKGYHCAGSMNDEIVKAYLYQPGETDDDDATKSSGPVNRGALVELPEAGVSCHCGLR